MTEKPPFPESGEVRCPKCRRDMWPRSVGCLSVQYEHLGEHLDWRCECGARTVTETADVTDAREALR